jgi:hypothetical protein
MVSWTYSAKQKSHPRNLSGDFSFPRILQYINAVTDKKIRRNINSLDFHVPRIKIIDLHEFAESEHFPDKSLFGGLGFYDSHIREEK